MQRTPRIGLVLGAGAARGWSHIGAIKALEALGVRPDVVAGCSSGAVVGAAYAAGRLDPLEDFVRALTWRRAIGYFDFSWRGGGLIEGRWIVDFFREHIGDAAIEAADIRFGAVATDLGSGRETWFTSGSIVDAVRASISLPGLLTPIAIDGRWLVDGALVNPIPVSLCRALGADVIIAVSMNGDLVTNPEAAASWRPALSLNGDAPAAAAEAARSSWLSWIAGGAPPDPEIAADHEATAPPAEPTAPPTPPRGRPGYFDVLGGSFFIVQNFVSRVRLAADPVDLLIAPDVGDVGLMDFHRGDRAVDAGWRAVMDAKDRIEALIGATPAMAELDAAAAPLLDPPTDPAA